MVDIVLLEWIIGLTSTLIGIYAGILILSSSKRLEGGLKISIFFLLVSQILYLCMGVGIGIMALKNIPYQAMIWIILPSLGLLSSLFFLLGAKKLLVTLLEVLD